MVTEADYRLPRTVVPSRYDITLAPDLERLTFEGSETVTVDVIEPVDEIVLNAVALDIGEVTLSPVSGGEAIQARVTVDPATERATLRLERTATPGPWELHASFRGALDAELVGFYRSTYTDTDGNEKTIASSQLQATDARRAFPCWDEPDLKATFAITLVVAEGLTAISNGREIAAEPTGDGRVAHRFAETMVMSTYLVAFVVGELEVTDPIDVDGVPLRVVVTPGKTDLTDFAAEVGAFSLRFFSDYYRIPYPGDKLDLIAIPDFAWGAMENVGAVTFRETALLVDQTKATKNELARIAETVAHELAHMWFGDLVTMKWWNGIWLNEAFATFMELKCADAFRPAWKTWLNFTDYRARSMDIDGLVATRPIEFPVASPEDANEMFDTLTYGKGAAVLRMLEQYLGEETFREGVAGYLAAHAYGNTETGDLWAALEEASGDPVGDIMQAWIFQGGYPQLVASLDDGACHITQEQFRYLGGGDARWKVPARFRSDEGEGRIVVEDAATLPAAPGLLLNAGGDGFYRVRYDGELRDDVADRIRDLRPEERFAVVGDVWGNVLAGRVAAADFLAIVSRLEDETEPAVWAEALGGLGELNRIIPDGTRPLLQRYVRDVVAPGCDRLGVEAAAGDSALTRELRGLLLRARGNLGDDGPTQEWARATFAAATGGGRTVDPDVAEAALAIVAANGGPDDFERFLALRRGATNPLDEARYLRALAAVPDDAMSARLLDMVVDGEVRRQDSFWTLAAMLGHRVTGVATWHRIRDRWDEVLASMPPQNSRRLLDQVHLRSEPDVAAEIRSWLQDHPIHGSRKFTPQVLERLQIRVGLREREAGRLAAALDS